MSTATLTITLDRKDESFSKSQFKSYIVSMSSNRIALGYRNNLMFTSLIGNNSNPNSNYSEDDMGLEFNFNPFFEMSMELNEIYGDISILKWLSDDVLCVGFESGLLACYDDEGDFLVEHRFHEVGIPIQSVKLSEKYKENHGGICLYVLFEDGYFIGVALSQLLASDKSKQNDTTNSSNICTYKFQLNAQEITSDFVVIPFNRYTTNSHNGVTSMTPTHINGYELYYDSILTSGYNCALAYHHLGTPKPKSNVNKLITNIKDKVSKAISKNISGTFSSFFGFGKDSKEIKEAVELSEKEANQISVPEAAPPANQLKLENLTSNASYELNDSKRRIMRMSVDPSGKLVATADSLGRVMLFDSRLHCMIRMWKGIRDARFAWTIGYTTRKRSGYGSGNSNGNGNAKKYKRVYSRHNSASSLCLAIYAPQLGLLSLFSMRHGPCVRSIPVGQQCQIFSIFEVSPLTGESLSKCALMQVSDDGSGIEISVVSPNENDDENVGVDLGDESETSPSILSDFLNEMGRENGSGSGDEVYTSDYDEDTMSQLKQLLQSVDGNHSSNRRRSNSNSVLVNALTRRIEHSHISGVGVGVGVDIDIETPISNISNELVISPVRTVPESGFGAGASQMVDADSTVVIVNNEEANKERDEQIRLIVNKLLDPTVEMKNTKKSLGPTRNQSRSQTPLPLPPPRSRTSTPQPGGLTHGLGATTNSSRQAPLEASVLTSNIEADVWLALSHITTTDALYACVELIDRVERERECPSPTFASTAVPPSVTSSLCAYVASSKRFSMEFHKNVCELIIKVGCNARNQMVVVEGCMRKRLLLAYEKLASFSSVSAKELLHRSGNSVFDLNKGTTSASGNVIGGATNGGGSDPVGMLVKQNTLRAEAFCWVSRACGKFQQQSDDSKAQLKREVNQMMQVNHKNYLLQDHTNTSSCSGNSRLRSPLLSPTGGSSGVSSPVPDRERKHFDSMGSASSFLSPASGASGGAVSGRTCTLPNITFSMFLGFHRFVWYKTDAEEVSGNGNGNVPLNVPRPMVSDSIMQSGMINDLCCVVEFRSDMLLEIVNSTASQVTYKTQREQIHQARQQYEIKNPSAANTNHSNSSSVLRSNIPPHMIYYDETLVNSRVPSLGTPLPPLARNGNTAAGQPMLSPSVSVNSLSSMSSFYSTSSSDMGGSFLSPTINSSGTSTYLSFQKKNISTTPLGHATTQDSGSKSNRSSQSRPQSPSIPSREDDSQQQDQVVYYGYVPIYPTACGIPPRFQSKSKSKPESEPGPKKDTDGTNSWKVPVWAAYDLLGLLMTPLVVKLDVFAVHDYGSVVLEHMGLGNGWGLRSFLPLLTCYLENIPAAVDTAPSDIALQSTSIIMNLLLYKQQASTSPIQRWLRDALLSFQDALHVDLDEEQQIMEGLMKRASGSGSGSGSGAEGENRSSNPLDVELVEYMNEHLKLITTRSLFVSQLMASGNVSTNTGTGTDSRFECDTKQGGYCYDDAIRFALRPMWLGMRDSVIFAPGSDSNSIRCGAFSSASEIMMGLGALFLETMGSVSEQLERRTYGLDSLKSTMEIWEILFRQYRVAILIGSRIPSCTVATSISSVNGNKSDVLSHYRKSQHLITVKALHEGENSMYRMLAEDTLCFSLHADQATEHESRCHAVYLKHSSLAGGGGPATLGTAGSDNGTATAPPVYLLTAWGEGANRRWKELLSVVEAEGGALNTTVSSEKQTNAAKLQQVLSSNSSHANQQNQNSNSNRNSIRRRKPLLLFFPLHNQQVPLGAYRSLVLAERWFKHPHSVELLSHSVSHLFPLPPVTKGAIAQHICYYYLFPFLRSYWLMEEGFNASVSNPNSSSSTNQHQTPKSYATPSKGSTGGGSSGSNGHGSNSGSGIKEGILPPPVPVMEISKEFLLLIRNHHQNTTTKKSTNATHSSSNNHNHLNNSELIRELIQAALDLISFADVLFRSKSGTGSGNGTGNGNALRAEADPDDSEEEDLEEYFDAMDTLPDGSECDWSENRKSGSLMGDEFSRRVTTVSERCRTDSTSIIHIQEEHSMEVRSVSNLVSNKTGAGKSDINQGSQYSGTCWPLPGDIVLSHIVREFQMKGGGNKVAVKAHCTLLLILLLRILCNLRRIRPSELFFVQNKSTSILDYMCLPDCISMNSTYRNYFNDESEFSEKTNNKTNGTKDTSKAMEKVLNMRHEFLLQCFRSLQHNFSAAVYRLGELWCIPVDAMRLYHIQVLLEVGNDDMAEEIVTMISNIGDVVDCVTNGLRFRVGVCLSRIDHIPVYGSLIMSMDAEAVAWGRSAITIPADPMIIELIANGKQKPIDFDVNASKHLVIRLQGLLLSISNGTKRDHIWHKRKNKCDMLLSLLSSLANYLRSR